MNEFGISRLRKNTVLRSLLLGVCTTILALVLMSCFAYNAGGWKESLGLLLSIPFLPGAALSAMLFRVHEGFLLPAIGFNWVIHSAVIFGILFWRSKRESRG